MPARLSPSANRIAGAVFLAIGLAVSYAVIYLMWASQLTGAMARGASFVALVQGGGLTAGGAYLLATGKNLGSRWREKSREERVATVVVVGVGVVVAVVLEVGLVLMGP